MTSSLAHQYAALLKRLRDTTPLKHVISIRVLNEYEVAEPNPTLSLIEIVKQLGKPDVKLLRFILRSINRFRMTTSLLMKLSDKLHLLGKSDHHFWFNRLMKLNLQQNHYIQPTCATFVLGNRKLDSANITELVKRAKSSPNFLQILARNPAVGSTALSIIASIYMANNFTYIAKSLYSVVLSSALLKNPKTPPESKNSIIILNELNQ